MKGCTYRGGHGHLSRSNWHPLPTYLEWELTYLSNHLAINEGKHLSKYRWSAMHLGWDGHQYQVIPKGITYPSY